MKQKEVARDGIEIDCTDPAGHSQSDRAALRLHLEELAVCGGALPIERRSPAVQVVVAA